MLRNTKNRIFLSICISIVLSLFLLLAEKLPLENYARKLLKVVSVINICFRINKIFLHLLHRCLRRNVIKYKILPFWKLTRLVGSENEIKYLQDSPYSVPAVPYKTYFYVSEKKTIWILPFREVAPSYTVSEKSVKLSTKPLLTNDDDQATTGTW